jgi:hypothetical protein
MEKWSLITTKVLSPFIPHTLARFYFTPLQYLKMRLTSALETDSALELVCDSPLQCCKLRPFKDHVPLLTTPHFINIPAFVGFSGPLS